MLVTAKCMTDAGYPMSVPFKDLTEAWKVAAWTSNGVRYFNERLAATYGYTEGHPELPNEEEWRAFYDQDFSDEKRAALDDCRDAHADELVGRQATDIYNLGAEFVWNAAEAADATPAVQEAAARWRECMKPLGLVDLPSSPYPVMPTESQRARFEEEHPSPGPLQLHDAMFDAACRESSGYAEAAYEAEWDEEHRIIAENIDEFERIRTEGDKYYQQAVRTIAELGASS
ncbi:hypothetical protein [Microbacterium sp.]|uniref:hypothetical protein n=1 Tax=Microbacterium sp. TaxID=51671 RepID=UPI003A87396A